MQRNNITLYKKIIFIIFEYEVNEGSVTTIVVLLLQEWISLLATVVEVIWVVDVG